MTGWLACPLSEPPGGSRCLQALWAASAWELLTCCSALTTALLSSIPPLLPGSRKFGTPCERMQDEYASSPVLCALPVAEREARAVGHGARR